MQSRKKNCPDGSRQNRQTGISLSQNAEKKNRQICGKLTINLVWKKKYSILYVIRGESLSYTGEFTSDQ